VSVALYLDVHVHHAITVELRKRGVDILTVQEDGTAAWPNKGGIADDSLEPSAAPQNVSQNAAAINTAKASERPSPPFLYSWTVVQAVPNGKGWFQTVGTSVV
jgi:hypothetical protein